TIRMTQAISPPQTTSANADKADFLWLNFEAGIEPLKTASIIKNEKLLDQIIDTKKARYLAYC
ncbi:MAG: hypothetical protein ACTHWG_08405, partial [Psychrobacter sp.]